MRKLLTLTFLTILFCLTSTVVWSETVSRDDLVERNGLYYKQLTILQIVQRPSLYFSRVPFSGQVKGKWNGEMRNGKMDGPWEIYHENGQLYIKGKYKDGKADGLWEYYLENGQLMRKENYKNGKQDGLFEFYHWNGQLWEKGHFKDGNKDGLWEYYDENGNLKRKETFKNGKKID